ncbi:cytochrome P450 6a2-like [Leguminivora glycinivorella]|uniref:cytochrome P450 6a2-like n=1 Tax=Leguminivora glycinivorella TaxID=1035111 RepID=UPI00200DA4F5|nr:cytochrome P450 6a2-like [Leguminivora glycinivorella]
MWLSVVLLVVLLSLIVLLAIFHYTTNGRKYWLQRKVLYREPCPIFGNFGAALTSRRSYAKTLQYFYEKYYKEKYVGIFIARRPTLMVLNMDIAKTIFSTDFSSFSDRVASTTDTRREPLLRNVFNMSGAEWKAMRQIISPAFSSAKMKWMFPLISECAHNLRNVLLNSLGEVEVPEVMCRYTTDVIGSCAFGVDPGSLKDPESPFLKMSKKMFKVDRATILKRYCRIFFPRLFKLLNLRSYPPDVEAFFTSAMSQVLQERRSGVQRCDFLQLMLDVQETEKEFEMTDALITSNSFIFMLAGLEASSTSLSFCLYHLATDEDLQDRVRGEIIECMERHGGLSFEAVSAMKLTTQVVTETLRLHPPTPMVTRLCTSPCVLSGTDLNFELRDSVLIPLQCMQRDARYFPDPEKFDPERFNDPNPPAIYTFGGGPRSCPGGRFAYLTLVAGLAAMLSKLEVAPSARTTPTIKYDPRSVMLKNKGGIYLEFKAL